VDMTTERYTVWWLTGGVCFALAHKLNTCQGQVNHSRLVTDKFSAVVNYYL